MKALPVKLVRLGHSTALIVPAAVTRLFGWQLGTDLRVNLVPGGPKFERRLRLLSGGHSLGIIIPVDILAIHGFERGETIEVPFHEWTLVESHGP